MYIPRLRYKNRIISYSPYLVTKDKAAASSSSEVSNGNFFRMSSKVDIGPAVSAAESVSMIWVARNNMAMEDLRL